MSLKKQLATTFLGLISIDGVYPDEERVTQYVEKRFRDSGVSFQRDAFNNLVVKIPGQGKPVLFSTHLDIPEPLPEAKYVTEGDVIRSDGSGILGADPKSGLAILVEFACEQAGKPSDTRRPVEMLLTRGEEAGLFGARNADYSLLSAKEGLVLDEDGPVTQVIVQAPCYIRFDARFEGKIVHPREPENGINALQISAAAMVAAPAGYSTPGVTWNIGVFSAGTARNSVPGSVSLKAELRSFDTKLALSEAERISQTFCQTAEGSGGTCTIDHELEFNGYALDKKDPLFVQLDKTFKTMKLRPNYFQTFGGSDANIFNAHGIRCVPIGSGYYNAHQYTEYVNVAEMAEIYKFLQYFIKQ
jgi:tripeptide aminopeptidase